MDAIHDKGWIAKLRLEKQGDIVKIAEVLHDHVDEFFHGFQTNGKSLREMDLEKDEVKRERSFRSPDVAKQIILQVYLTSLAKGAKGEDYQRLENIVAKLNVKEEAKRTFQLWEGLPNEGDYENSLKILADHRLITKIGDRYVKKKREDIPEYLSDIKALRNEV